jgi:hypothetical protein
MTDHNPKSIDHDDDTTTETTSFSAREHRPDITMHFYTDDPDSMRRFRLCNQAEGMKLVLWEFDQWLRGETKYGITDEFMRSMQRTYDAEREVAEDVLNVVRKELHRICADNGIDLTED